MSAVEKEIGMTRVKQESNLTIEDEVLETQLDEDETRTSVKQESSLIRKRVVPDTLMRKRKKRKVSSDRENKEEKVVEEESVICQEGKPFNWRNYQWQTAISAMNTRIVNILSSFNRNIVCTGQEESALEDNPKYIESHKNMDSGIEQLPPLDVPSEWVLESSPIESSSDILEETNISEGSISSLVRRVVTSEWILETSPE